MEAWEKVTLGSVASIKNGGTPSTGTSSYWSDDGHIWLTPDDLSKGSKYTSTSRRRISDEGLGMSSAALLPMGSLVMSSRAPIGYLTILTEPAATSQGCKGIELDLKQVDPEFAYYFLSANMEAIKRRGSGSTFAEISGRELAQIPLSLPPLEEQRHIANILALVDKDIEAAARVKEQKDLLKKAIVKELLGEG
jgi:type I restriction enzyme S subunit